MARKTQREVPIDTALAFCFARTNQLPELEEFLRGTNVADVEASGDKAYEEGYHEAAKIFFTSISNWAKLATTLVHLEDYQAAVECARKANSVKGKLICSLVDIQLLISCSLETSQRGLCCQERVPPCSDLRSEPYCSRRRALRAGQTV